MIRRLFEVFTTVGAEWVMFLLVALSVLSVALIFERLIYFLRFSSSGSGELIPLLAQGQFDEVRRRLAGRRGLEVAVVGAALDAAPGGPGSVQAAMACVIAHRRPSYERFLAALGTLGNNAPFLGLFGTVVGIIKAFSDLALGTAAAGAKAAGAAVVMSGISEALVATAVGIFVAIPAVVAFNGYNRWLKIIVGRSEALGHALISHLEKDEVRSQALAVLSPSPGVCARAVA